MATDATQILFSVVIVLAAAKLGGEAARRARMPGVLGEIVAGILLGPTAFGVLTLTAASEPNVDVLLFLAELGVLLLLFEVGLESDLGQLRRVGASAAMVGFLGVLLSLLVGAATSYGLVFLGDWNATPAGQANPWHLHIFIGAILTATSVGITARVLSEMGRVRSREAQVILGAAVVDDVLGLIVLAVMGGVVTGALTATGIALVVVKAVGFFVGGILVASWAFPRILRHLHRAFKADFVHFGFAVLFMLGMAYLAGLAGLATIVGAFVAGIAFSGSEHRHTVFEQVRPMASLFTGFFFVLLGAHVDLHAFPVDRLGFALAAILALTTTAVASKLASGAGVLRGQADRIIVGVGMVPRGEVGFIFALAALQFGILANWQYSLLIVVIMLTTLAAPPALKALQARFRMADTEPDQARLQITV